MEVYIAVRRDPNTTATNRILPYKENISYPLSYISSIYVMVIPYITAILLRSKFRIFYPVNNAKV